MWTVDVTGSYKACQADKRTFQKKRKKRGNAGKKIAEVIAERSEWGRQKRARQLINTELERPRLRKKRHIKKRGAPPKKSTSRAPSELSRNRTLAL